MSRVSNTLRVRPTKDVQCTRNRDVLVCEFGNHLDDVHAHLSAVDRGGFQNLTAIVAHGSFHPFAFARGKELAEIVQQSKSKGS